MCAPSCTINNDAGASPGTPTQLLQLAIRMHESPLSSMNSPVIHDTPAEYQGGHTWQRANVAVSKVTEGERL